MLKIISQNVNIRRYFSFGVRIKKLKSYITK